jgi:hypothetical protein
MQSFRHYWTVNLCLVSENVTFFLLHLKGFITLKLNLLCLSKLVIFEQITVISFVKLAFFLNLVTSSTVAVYFLPFVSFCQSSFFFCLSLSPSLPLLHSFNFISLSVVCSYFIPFFFLLTSILLSFLLLFLYHFNFFLCIFNSYLICTYTGNIKDYSFSSRFGQLS